jgi:hypothetical protein
LEENNIQEDRETDVKSSLTIYLSTGLQHSVLVEKKDKAYKMYLYTKELTIKCEEGQRHPLKCEIHL